MAVANTNRKALSFFMLLNTSLIFYAGHVATISTIKNVPSPNSMYAHKFTIVRKNTFEILFRAK